MTKVGKSDGEGTFAGTRGNDKVAPIPAIRRVAAINAREVLVVFQGSAKMFTVEDTSGALQKGFAAPDITPTYCLPATA